MSRHAHSAGTQWRRPSRAAVMLALAALTGMQGAQAGLAPAAVTAPAAVGPGDVVVQTAFGGFILGYDIDSTGTQGLLSEARSVGGQSVVAVETFDLTTGEIISIVTRQTNTRNDFVTLGVIGNRTGLVEFEHVTNLFVDRRVYLTLDPLTGNRITGRWTPPLETDEIIEHVAQAPGSPVAAVLAFGNGGLSSTLLFSSNVAENTFGPLITITDPLFVLGNSPAMAFDDVNNQVVIGASNGCPLCRPRLATIDLADGTEETFAGRGLGYVNGMAIDSAAGLVVTTTEIDANVEFYDLATRTAIVRRMPNALSQAHSGKGIAFDPVNKLFLIQQPMSSTAPTGSSVQVFDEEGNFVESIDGLKMPVSPINIALVPESRTGFVLVTPELTTLQSFTY